jgi:hypothetical protein
MKPRLKRALVKTSVQLPPDVFRDMTAWPGLTRSEAIRLAVERALYVATINAEGIANLADDHFPILSPALGDFDYQDFQKVARALPAIVEGFVRENPNLSWRYEGGDRHELDPGELVKKLTDLDAVGRIGVLDCVVAQRHRNAQAIRLPRARSERRSTVGAATQ